MSLGLEARLHRFGYGPHLGQGSLNGLGTHLSGPDPALALYPGLGDQEALLLRNDMRERASAAREEGSRAGRRDTRKSTQQELEALSLDALKLDLARAIEAPDSYRERLARFWCDHFTIIIRDPPDQPRLLPYYDQTVRPHVGGTFGEMLSAAILHPMMLVYLDQSKSIGPSSAFGQKRGRGLNENLARELLELHTLGVEGGYSQDDVRELAKLLTGLTVSRDGLLTFEPDRAEPGAETLFGKRYGGLKPSIGDIHAVLADLARHPATAQHLSRKLVVHFTSDMPDPRIIADLAQVWSDTSGDLAQVSARLLDHPALPEEFLKARQPYDFVIASLRALGVTGAEVMGWDRRMMKFIVSDPLRLMAQPWMAPLGPDGWEEDLERWITPQALARRINWAMSAPQRLRKTLPDAREFVAALMPYAAPELHPIIARAETNTEGIGLALASPQFNRR